MLYLISSGSYSDYSVCFLAKCKRKVDEGEFRTFWLEAIKQKTDYVDEKLGEVAKILGVPKESWMWDYAGIVGYEKFHEALGKVGYESLGEQGFFEKILIEQGFSILPFEEYNTDDF